MRKTSIMIVEDHTLLRESWEKILGFNIQYLITFSTGDGEAAMHMASVQPPDVILLDINLTPLDGFELAKRFQSICPESKVIAVSMHAEPSFAKKMFRNGAKGYVTKNSTTEELMTGIDRVMSGGMYVCQEMEHNLSASILHDDTAISIESLTDRQLEIIALIKQGLSTRNIATNLNLSVKTIEVHKRNIFRLLKVNSTLTLLKAIHEYGL